MNHVAQYACRLQGCTQIVPSVLQYCIPFDMQRSSIELYKAHQMFVGVGPVILQSDRDYSEEHQLLHIYLKITEVANLLLIRIKRTSTSSLSILVHTNQISSQHQESPCHRASHLPKHTKDPP